MIHRTRIAALLAASTTVACAGGTGGSAAPAPAAPRPFEYAAGTATYRFIQTSTTTQSMMGQSQDLASSGTRVVTLTLVRNSPDTMTLSAVLDSLTFQGPPGTPAPDFKPFVGKTVGAKLSPSGTVYSVTGPTEPAPLAATVTDELGRMLPRIRGVLTPGHTWTDTLQDAPRQGPLELKRIAVTVYTVLADTTMGAEAAWKIGRKTTTTITGQGFQGTQINFEGTGGATGTVWMSKLGVLLGGDVEDTLDGRATVPANGMEIGVKTASSMKVMKVR